MSSQHPHPLFRVSIVAACALFMSSAARAETHFYKIDNTHSFANWQVRHVVALTSGTFHDVQGKVVLNTDDLAKSSVEASISLHSLNSSHLKRDLHLLDADYFAARDYPAMRFVSTRVTPATPETGVITGTLSLRGESRPVTLDYTILGVGRDPWGGMRAGFKAGARLKRSDFGIGKPGDAGPVGNDIEITLLIEGIRVDEAGQPWKAMVAEPAPKAVAYPAPAQPGAEVKALPTEPVAPAAQSAPVKAAPATPAPAAPVPVIPAPANPAAATVAPAPATPTQPAAPEAKRESTGDKLKKELLKSLFK